MEPGGMLQGQRACKYKFMLEPYCLATDLIMGLVIGILDLLHPVSIGYGNSSCFQTQAQYKAHSTTKYDYSNYTVKPDPCYALKSNSQCWILGF
jgi:hypothetical protein